MNDIKNKMNEYSELKTRLDTIQKELDEYCIEYTQEEKELLSKMEDLYFEMSWKERDQIDAENTK